jgi:hypothetical protein
LCVLVSDNSDPGEDVEALERACRDLGDARLHYVRPPKVMALPAHWEWALEQAFALTGATHFGVQYDRKLWKPGELAALWQAAMPYPHCLLSYPSDVVVPSGEGFVYGQVPATGKLYRISCERVIALTARGMIRQMGQTFPVLSNCIVPRAIFDRIRAVFGNLCDSSTPDAAFSYRFCALESAFHYRDLAPAVVHAFRFSNARSFFSGVPGGTWDDFVRLWGGEEGFLDASPIPELNLGQNVSFHEYSLVRSTAAGKHFPPIDRQGHLRELALALPEIEDPAKREAMRARLQAYGWREEPPPSEPPPRPGILSRPRRLAGRLLRSVGLRRPLPPSVFASESDAIAYVIDHPRPRLSHNPEIEIMEPVEVEPVRALRPLGAGREQE